MKTILVVDDMAIFRDPIAASLRLAGYQTLCAADGEEALRITRAHRPDVLLLDGSMPKMDGLTFLKHLRADPTIAGTRVILLTALSESKYVIAAGGMGVRDYLLKSRFRLADLMARIEKAAPAPAAPDAAGALASTSSLPTATGSAAPEATSKPADVAAPTAGLPAATGPVAPPKGPKASVDGTTEQLTQDVFSRRVGEAFSAKTLSGVVAQVIAMASSPLGDVTQLAGLIARDAMLSVRVIQAANSAAYSSRGAAVTNITDAIKKLGFATIRNIAASLGVFDCMPEVGPDGFDPIRYWQHSFAVAHLCESFAATFAPAQSGLAYVVGLCHDLGEIFLRTVFAAEYQQVLDAAERTGRSREDLYGETFGMGYPELVCEILNRMGLPSEIRGPIQQFHAGHPTRSTSKLTHALWLADNYANAAMLASGVNAEVEPIAKAFYDNAVGPAGLQLPDPLMLRTQVISLTVTLARLSKADEAKLMVPLFTAGRGRLWVVRSPAVAGFDPISLALESLARVTVSASLPKPDELAKVDGVVLLGGVTDAALLSQQTQALAQATPPGVDQERPLLSMTCRGRDEGPAEAPSPASGTVSLARLAQFANSQDRRPEHKSVAA